MKHSAFPALALLVLLLLCLPLAVPRAQEGRYADLIQVFHDYMDASEEVITALDQAQSAEEVTAAMRLFLEATKTYLERAEAMEEKYPELGDEVPEELEQLLEDFGEIMTRLNAAMVKLGDYQDDPELLKVMEEIQNLQM